MVGQNLKTVMSHATRNVVTPQSHARDLHLCRYGFQRDGYNSLGYNKDNQHRDGFNKDGFDKYGFNKDGFDKNGFNKYGFDKFGYKSGYDISGFDHEGKDKSGKGRWALYTGSSTAAGSGTTKCSSNASSAEQVKSCKSGGGAAGYGAEFHA